MGAGVPRCRGKKKAEDTGENGDSLNECKKGGRAAAEEKHAGLQTVEVHRKVMGSGK